MGKSVAPPAQPPLQHTPNNRALHVGRNGMIRRGPRTSRDRARDEHTQKGTTEHPTGLTRRRLAPKHGAPEGFCQVQASQHGHNGTPRAGFVSDNRTWGRCGLAMPGPRRGCHATRCAAHTATSRGHRRRSSSHLQICARAPHELRSVSGRDTLMIPEFWNPDFHGHAGQKKIDRT